eukprot:g7193.t1
MIHPTYSVAWKTAQIIPDTDYVKGGLKKAWIREINRRFMEAEGPSASVLLDEASGVEWLVSLHNIGFLTLEEKRLRTPRSATCKKETAVTACAMYQFCNQPDPNDVGACESCPPGKFRSAADPTLCISRTCSDNDDCPAEAQVCNLLMGSPGVCFNPGGITQGSPCTMQNWKTQCSSIELCQNSFCVAKCSGPGQIRSGDGNSCVCRAGWGPGPGGAGCVQGGAGSGGQVALLAFGSGQLTPGATDFLSGAGAAAGPQGQLYSQLASQVRTLQPDLPEMPLL